MAIRSPSISVTEAKRLAKSRSDGAAVSPAPSSGSPPSPPSPTQEIVPPPASVPALPSQPAASRPPAASEDVSTIPPVAPVFAEEKPADPKIQVFLSAPLPAAGVSRSFDMLRRQYSAGKALQMVLRRALDAYDVHLENGTHRTAPTHYPIGDLPQNTVIQTSRMVPVRLVNIARTHFDPLGFETTRAFGRKLACAALATFFEAEKTRRK
ncbi:VirC2 family conjugal transfer protein [Agrobacterium vitis]|uniref:VirC2 family conjugal transfer protein n=1 Tax=Agrobacterium vitis TaxID=373 RepID=UPI003D26E7B8